MALEIMEYLGPPQLYLLRQTCRMFWRLFTDRKFAYLHKELVWFPTNLKPNERIPVDFRGSMIEFNQRNGSPEWRQAAKLLMKDHLCQDCRANQDSILRHRCLPKDYIQRRYWTPVLCNGCNTEHSLACFSEAQAKSARPRCMAWEGKLQICPHRYMPLLDKNMPSCETLTLPNNWMPRTIVPACPKCVQRFSATRGEVPPRIAVDALETAQLEWIIEICELEKSQLITKDLLRSRL